MDATVPAEISKAMAAGSATPPTLSPDELNAWKQLDLFYKKGWATRTRCRSGRSRGAEELGRARVPEAALLQQGGEGRPLRGVGAAGAVRAGAEGGGEAVTQ